MLCGVVLQMSYQSPGVATSIVFGITQLATNLAAALTEPDEIHRCELPGNPGMRWRVCDGIRGRRGRVTCSTGEFSCTAATRTAVDVHAVWTGSGLAGDGP